MINEKKRVSAIDFVFYDNSFDYTSGTPKKVGEQLYLTDKKTR